jgi:hypothetical protein
MSLDKQNKPQPSVQRSNDAFIRPSAPEIAKMNKENPNRKVANSDFDPEVKLNRFGEPAFNQPNRTVQARLKMGQVNDKYEKEADSVADKVVNQSITNGRGTTNSPDSSIQKQEEKDIEVQAQSIGEDISPIVQKMETEDEPVQRMEEDEVQQKKNEGGGNKPSNIEGSLKSSKGRGSKMDSNTMSQMESGFGMDFSNVNIHTGPDAIQMNQDLGAKAFTNGNDVYFNKGEYNPASKGGKHLLAHELTHTVQQSKGSNTLSKVQEKSQSNASNQKPRNSKARNETIQRISSMNGSSNMIQPFLGMGLGVGAGLGYAAYKQIKKFRRVQARFSALRGRINFLRMRSGLNNMLSGGNGQIRFTSKQWNKLQKRVGKTSLIASRASSYSMLGFTGNVPSALSTFLGAGVASGGGMVVSAVALEGLLGSLAGSAAVGIGIALGEILLVILVIAIIIAILYLLYLVVEVIVETVAEAIEQLRRVAPIFWPLTLPMPGPFGYIMPRVFPANPRLSNGGQRTLAKQLKKQRITGMDAHHIHPLFLGGYDTLANVTPLQHHLHMLGHLSLVSQPQLVALGLSPYLYSHRPPMMFFIAGRKP